MSKLTDDLFASQKILQLGGAATPEQQAQLAELRDRVPLPIMTHLLRQLAGSRRGIVLVRNGICGECHLRLSHAMSHVLAISQELLLCENCGAFLVLVPTDAAPVLVKRPPRAARQMKSTAAMTH